MANTIRYRLRSDTAANWESVNLVLLSGEPGYDKTNNRFKMGDGSTAWKDLPYLKDDDTIYTHPTSEGNNHIPAGGSSGQVLQWSAAGMATWVTVPSETLVFTLEDDSTVTLKVALCS